MYVSMPKGKGKKKKKDKDKAEKSKIKQRAMAGRPNDAKGEYHLMQAGLKYQKQDFVGAAEAYRSAYEGCHKAWVGRYNCLSGFASVVKENR